MDKSFELKQLAFQTRFAAEVIKAHNAFLEKIPEIKQTVDEARALSNEARTQLSRIQKLPKGEKGDSIRGPQGIEGRPGKTPVKGKDYLTDKEIQEIARRASAMILLPADGKDAEVDYDLILEKTFEMLKDKDYLKEDIEGIRKEMTSYRNQMAMRQAGQHGGGTTVSAGTNITLTPLPDGTTRIDATGSGTGTVDSVVAGTGISVDATDPANPIVSSTITQYTDALARAAISLTTTGTDGPATYDDTTGVLNIPDYAGGETTPYLVSTTTVDLVTVGTTNLYTVPAGKKLVITSIVLRPTVATDVGTPAKVGVGVAAGEDDVWASTTLTGFTTSAKVYKHETLGAFYLPVEGDVVKMGVDTAAN